MNRIETSFEIGVLSFNILVLFDDFVHIQTICFCILYASQECAKCWYFCFADFDFLLGFETQVKQWLSCDKEMGSVLLDCLVCEWKIYHGILSIYVYVKILEQRISIIAFQKEFMKCTMTLYFYKNWIASS